MKSVLRSVAVFATVAISFVLASCEKSQQLEKCEDVQEVTKIQPTIETFAKALSAAVYQHEEMRSFIKDEALKQFDKDYDVFYPFVKDEEIAEGKTFREFLLGYLSEPELDRIEAEHPLLDIAVPDWSLIEGFSVDSWDTTDQDLSIGYKNEKGGLSLFNNGEREFETMSGQIPGFPTLIVKDNERMRKLPSAKAGNPCEYDIIDDAFDNTLMPETKVSHDYYDRTFDVEDYSNFISANEVFNTSTSSVGAYEAFAGDNTAAHRDYIYYGMNRTITYGKLNVHVTEYITKFRLGRLNSEFILESGDFVDCPESYTTNSSPSDEKLFQKFCYDGNLELKFRIIIGNSVDISKYKSVTFREAFQLKNVHVDYRHKTWFSDKKWVYSVDYECFVPKWINADIQLPKWDISTQSSEITINVSEVDQDIEHSYTITALNSRSSNFTTETELGKNMTITAENVGNASSSGKIKVGYGYVSKDELTTTEKIIVKDTTDDLGTAILNYSAPVILSRDTVDGVSGFRINEINTGFVYMLILPKYE